MWVQWAYPPAPRPVQRRTLWQLLTFVVRGVRGVLLAVAIVGLGHSRSRSPSSARRGGLSNHWLTDQPLTSGGSPVSQYMNSGSTVAQVDHSNDQAVPQPDRLMT